MRPGLPHCVPVQLFLARCMSVLSPPTLGAHPPRRGLAWGGINVVMAPWRLCASLSKTTLCVGFSRIAARAPETRNRTRRGAIIRHSSCQIPGVSHGRPRGGGTPRALVPVLLGRRESPAVHPERRARAVLSAAVFLVCFTLVCFTKEGFQSACIVCEQRLS